VGSLACRAGENKKLLQNSTYGLSALKAILDAMEGSGFATGTDSLKVLSDVLDLIRTELTFQHQADATLSQASPGSGTKYTVLDTTAKARIIVIAVKCIWTVQPTPLEVHVTIDGVSLTFTVSNPVSDTWYQAALDPTAGETSQVLTTTNFLPYRSFLLEGRSVKVEAEITGGTVSQLDARIKYAKR